MRSNDTHNNIKCNSTPLETAGYSIPIIYEFNDLIGTANMSQIANNKTLWIKHKKNNLIWKKFKLASDNSGLFVGKQSNKTIGSFKFNIRFPGLENSRDLNLPHLPMNSKSNAIDLIIDSVEPAFKNSKFGVNIVLLSKFSNMSQTNQPTINDEYTPGTFNLWNIQLYNATVNQMKNYIQ